MYFAEMFVRDVLRVRMTTYFGTFCYPNFFKTKGSEVYTEI